MTIKLKGREMNLADYEFARYGVRVPTGTTLEQVMQPEYFQNYLKLLGKRPHTRLEVVSDCGTLDCDFRVLSVTHTTAKLRSLRVYQPEAAQAGKTKKPALPELPEGFAVGHGGPHHRWRFLHDGQVVEHGFGSEAEAYEKALQYAGKALS